MATFITRPTLDGASMPFPSSASIEPIWIKAEHITLGGTTRRELMARKYQYTLTWDYMTVTDYNTIETKVNGAQPKTFIYNKWPQSASAGVSVLFELSTRQLVSGSGDASYLSSVTLNLTEVASRI